MILEFDLYRYKLMSMCILLQDGLLSISSTLNSSLLTSLQVSIFLTWSIACFEVVCALPRRTGRLIGFCGCGWFDFFSVCGSKSSNCQEAGDLSILLVLHDLGLLLRFTEKTQLMMLWLVCVFIH